MKKEHRRWMLDRRIPITVVMTVCIQVAATLVWATSLDARVSSVEQKTLSAHETREKLARIEERLDYMKQDIGFIKQQLNYLTNHFIAK
jgi:hypothetical protein